MEFLVDTEGFIKPVVFLVASFIILFLSYKKNWKLLWLAFLPVAGLMFYDEYKIDVRTEREQHVYLSTTWIDMYEPLSVNILPVDDSEDLYDEWMITTEGGKYLVRFNEGSAKGYEIFETLHEEESLIGRKNALDIMKELDIEGLLTYNVENYEYTVSSSYEKHKIKMNTEGRVDEVKDESGILLYKNEENGDLPEGRPLLEEEVG